MQTASTDRPANHGPSNPHSARGAPARRRYAPFAVPTSSSTSPAIAGPYRPGSPGYAGAPTFWRISSEIEVGTSA
jgi:hypothetical protein